MPKLAQQDMENHRIGGSTFGFSAKRIENLGATEYTLGTVIVDVSGSVDPFKKEIEDCVKEVVKACRRNPRADNMMLRLVLFDDRVQEFHGFKPLPDCNDTDYDGCIKTGGTTALFDAVYSSIKAMMQYGTALVKQDFGVNAAVFVITDGWDNSSKVSRNMVEDALKDAVQSESVESVMPVLIGVNVDQNSGLNSALEDFKNEAGFQQYVAIAKANEKSIAKLGKFISQSLSSQSQALGTGGPSKSLVF